MNIERALRASRIQLLVSQEVSIYRRHKRAGEPGKSGRFQIFLALAIDIGRIGYTILSILHSAGGSKSARCIYNPRALRQYGRPTIKSRTTRINNSSNFPEATGFPAFLAVE